MTRTTLALSAVVAISIASCSALDGATYCADDGGSCGETPPPTAMDASLGDAGRPPPPPSDAGPSDDDGRVDPARDASIPGSDASPPTEDGTLCLDSADNDGDGAEDCADPACGAAAACCVDNAVCCGAPVPALALGFAACPSGTPAASCADVDALGTVTPVIATRPGAEGDVVGLSVGGDLRADNGVVTAAVASDGAIELDADLHVFAADCDAAGRCAESITVGLVGQATPSASPWVALTVSLDLMRVVLRIDDRVVATTAFAGFEGPLSMRIAVDAAGVVTATMDSDGREIARSSTTTSTAPPLAHAAVFGRSANVPSARLLVRRIDVTTSTCDRPRAMATGQPFRLQGGAPLVAERTPSLASDLASDVHAGIVVVDGAVRGGRYVLADGERNLELDAEPWLLPLENERITSADLVHVPLDPDTPWWLFVVVEPAPDGPLAGANARIALSRSGTLGAFDSSTLSAELRRDDSIDLPVGDVDGVAQGGSVLFAHRADPPSGSVVYLTSLAAGTLEAVAHGVILHPGESPTAFDHDGVASPSLVGFRGLLHLFYTGRRGTSASVGYVYSVDGRYWQRYAGGPVVTPADGVLAVGDPEAWFLPDLATEGGPTQGVLEIVYAANDGSRSVLDIASRRVFVGTPSTP